LAFDSPSKPAILKLVGHPDEIASYQYIAMPMHINR
jgi:hypothetical protein